MEFIDNVAIYKGRKFARDGEAFIMGALYFDSLDEAVRFVDERGGAEAPRLTDGQR